MAMTDGLGVDVAIEAVGIPLTFDMCTELVRPGGTVANAGVHGRSVEPSSRICGSRTSRSPPGWWSATTTPMLLKLVDKLRPKSLPPTISPSTRCSTFGCAAETKALKVVINR